MDDAHEERQIQRAAEMRMKYEANKARAMKEAANTIAAGVAKLTGGTGGHDKPELRSADARLEKRNPPHPGDAGS